MELLCLMVPGTVRGQRHVVVVGDQRGLGLGSLRARNA